MTEFERVKAKRIELQNLLIDILGNKNVYFQPPETIKLNYPCIIYELNNIATTHADNVPYKKDYSYKLTLIGTDTISESLIKLTNIPQCKFDRRFYSDGLYHDVFTIQF